MSIGNYTVLQRLESFLYTKEKQVVKYLHSCRFFKSRIIPQYTIAFSEIPYQEIKKRERAQWLCIVFILLLSVLFCCTCLGYGWYALRYTLTSTIMNSSIQALLLFS